MIALGVALIASLSIHLPVYGFLGELAKWFEGKVEPVAEADPYAEYDFVEFEADEGDEAEPDDVPEPDERRRPESQRAEEAWERREVEPEQPPEPEEAEMEIVRQVEDRMNLQAIQQRSADPDAEAPENPRYIAEENSRVEEETQASIRNYSMDAPQVEAGEPLEQSEQQDEGNADEQLTAEHREMEGSEDRDPTEQEANMERPEEASNEQLPDTTSRGETDQRESEAVEEQRRQTEQQAQREAGGAEYETVTVSDGQGTFTIRRRVEPEGTGGGTEGGDFRRAQEARDGRRGRTAQQRGRGRGQGAQGPDLRVSWNQFEEILGEEQLREERERYVRERLSKQRGNSRERQERWADFRAALENYTPDVRPGNQTALNAAASPFANYIAAVHRRIHRTFYGRFIRGLPAGASNPFNDMSLRTKLEIVFNTDGSIDRVGIVRTSGLLPFDYGAYNAVMRGQPYPAPPNSILSGNGKVYIHWGFYRNARQCGTFNAEPFILPNPPGSPRPRRGPLQDNGPQWGGVVPRDARPTWGTEGEAGSSEEGEEEAPAEEEEEQRGPDAARHERERLPGNLG